MFEGYPDMVNVKQLCHMLRIGRNMAYRLLKDKKIAAVQIGSIYRIPKIEVEQFVQRSVASGCSLWYTKTVEIEDCRNCGKERIK